MNLGIGEFLIVLAVWGVLIWAFFALIRWAVRSALQQFLEANREELVEIVRKAVAKDPERNG